MCLLFLYVNDDPRESAYRLILINNRDEFWDRPTKPLSCWESNPQCFSAQDLEAESKRGTWLAMSKDGKIGVLVNIMGIPGKDKKSRGDLVHDFLTSSLCGKDYIEQCISPHREDYNGFHLVLLDLSDKDTKFEYFSNKSDEILNLNHGFCGLGNSVLPSKPWKKCGMGLEKFKCVVQDKSKVKDNESLISDLHKVLSSSERYADDDVLQRQAANVGHDDVLIGELSSVFVHSGKHRYGTRTHSYILVDHSGHCEFRQTTLVPPVDPDEFHWRSDIEKFSLQA